MKYLVIALLLVGCVTTEEEEIMRRAQTAKVKGEYHLACEAAYAKARSISPAYFPATIIIRTKDGPKTCYY